ncbi:MAG: hypothetical protein OXI92_14440 [Acidobacteriota bacterium]|nr:hypothetical protein [Acidobacteriota bacterium]
MWGLLACGLTSAFLYRSLPQLAPAQEKIPELVTLFLGLFLLYLLSLWLSMQASCGLRARLPLILLFALAFRLLLLPAPPALSDDVYRYLWEGYLQTEGINPYEHSPHSPVLEEYRNPVWTSVNNKEVSAIYPPFAQMVHALFYLGFRSVSGFKLAFLGVEIGLVAAILALLKRSGRPLGRVLVYAWNPLVVIEVAWSGHHDVLVVGLLLWALFLLQIRTRVAAMGLLAAAVLTKLYPVILAPAFLRGQPARYWGWLAGFLLAMLLPYLGAGGRLWEGLSLYRDQWRFNGFLHSWLTGWGLPQIWLEGLLGAGILILLSICWVRGICRLRQLYWLTGAVLLFSPTLFPWYLVWIVPFLCFFPNPAWLLLSGLSVLSYEVLNDWSVLGIWRSDPFFLKLQYYPFWGMLALLGTRSLWRRRQRPAQ